MSTKPAPVSGAGFFDARNDCLTARSVEDRQLKAIWRKLPSYCAFAVGHRKICRRGGGAFLLVLAFRWYRQQGFERSNASIAGLAPGQPGLISDLDRARYFETSTGRM
jgi:hypothetical protein